MDDRVANQTVTYAYDYVGNITEVKTYAYTTKELGEPLDIKEYIYNSQNQRTDLSYDEKGNLTELNGYTFTWKERSLTSATSAEQSVSFTYNHDGIRTSKTVNGVTTTYKVDENNNVIEQRDGTDVVRFVYDSSNTPLYMEYQEQIYYYEKNLQGDIIALLDGNGKTVVEYTYDIWGRLLGITGEQADTIGMINPLRYRGYYYDSETELYYLQSRYYAPEQMRFLSQDDPVFSNEQGEPLGSNLYAYCLNNPVLDSDPSGCFSVPRTLIVIAIDAGIWAWFSLGASTFAFLTQPVKAIARYAGKAVIKAKMLGILRGFTNTLATAIVKVSKYLVPVIQKSGGRILRRWTKKMTATKISQMIAGGLASVTANAFLDSIANNITLFLSVGGMIGGLWDWYSDKKLNGWIKLW